MDGEGDMGGGGWAFLWTCVYRSVFVCESRLIDVDAWKKGRNRKETGGGVRVVRRRGGWV